MTTLKSNFKRKYLLLLLALISVKAFSQTTHNITDPEDIKNLTLNAGDTVVLADGTYDTDARVVFSGNGTAAAPITFRPESPGGVIFTGGMQMSIAGNYMVVDGFYWNGGVGASNFIEFRDSDVYAQNCTIQNCAINGLVIDPAKVITDAANGSVTKHRWIVLYGNYNNVLNCTFMNKSSAGALVLVELEYNASPDDGVTNTRCDLVGHTIANNYFYKYNKIDSDLSNSGDSETIRVGTSEFQNVNCGTTVSNNYFVEADGENEIITNKSANNIYENNTFRRCRGSLVLRHGSGATVNKNYFLGENVDGTGGIRIVDSEHIITNNYIQDCITVLEQAKWNNGLTFMGGGDSNNVVCTSTSVSNGYQKVENIEVSNNTIINTNAPLFYNGDKGTNDNTGVVTDNLIYFQDGNVNETVVMSEDDSGDYSAFGETLEYSGNIFGGTTLGLTSEGFSEEVISVTADGEIFAHNQDGKGADMGGFKPHTDAMVGSGVGACFLDADAVVIANPDCTIQQIDKLTVNEITDFKIQGESKAVVLNTNVAWTVSESLDWLEVTPNLGVGDGNDSVTITVTENPDESPRSGVITFNQDGGDLFATLNITQVGAELNIASISDFSVNEGTKSVVVDANVAWTATENIDWVTISPSSGTGEGNDSITITFTENPNAALRSGVISFTQDGGDLSATLTVTQAAQNAEDLYNLINDLGLDDLVEIHSFSKQQVGDDNGTNRTNYASNTLDKDTSTRWAADDLDTVADGEIKADGEYIIYDLGAIYDLDAVRLRSDGKDDAYGYQLLTSESGTDEGDFTKLIPVSEDIMLTQAGSSAFQQHEVVVSARYIKLLGFGRFDADITERKSVWTNVTEIEFFGTSDDPASDEDFVFSETIIYPVPANNSVTLKNYTDLSTVAVLSIDGKLLATQNVESFDSSITVDTSSLGNGIYLLKLSNTSGTSATRKIVVQH